VGGIACVIVATGIAVDIVTAVLVGGGGGRVGVLNGAAWVNCACTVSAAAVNTTFGSLGFCVAALDGKLHAEIMSTEMLKIEMMRKVLNIFSPQSIHYFTRIQTDKYYPLFLTASGCKPLLSKPQPASTAQAFPGRIFLTDGTHGKGYGHCSDSQNQKQELQKLLFCWIKLVLSKIEGLG
jgi:hypothetical protein